MHRWSKHSTSWHNVPNREVLVQFRRNLSGYTSVAGFSISKMAFEDVRAQRITASFDRSWDFRGNRDFTGSEREQMIFQTVEGKWRITSETELKIYWTRREKAPDPSRDLGEHQ